MDAQLNIEEATREEWIADFWRALAEDNGIAIDDIELEGQDSLSDFEEE